MKELAGVMDCGLSLLNWQFRGGGKYERFLPSYEQNTICVHDASCVCVSQCVSVSVSVCVHLYLYIQNLCDYAFVCVRE